MSPQKVCAEAALGVSCLPAHLIASKIDRPLPHVRREDAYAVYYSFDHPTTNILELLPSLTPVIDVGGQGITLPAMLPVMSGTPGRTKWAGPQLSYHTQHVLRQELDLDDAAILALQQQKII